MSTTKDLTIDTPNTGRLPKVPIRRMELLQKGSPDMRRKLESTWRASILRRFLYMAFLFLGWEWMRLSTT